MRWTSLLVKYGWLATSRRDQDSARTSRRSNSAGSATRALAGAIALAGLLGGTAQGAARYACMGGDLALGQPPIAVKLIVDAAGKVLDRVALRRLSTEGQTSSGSFLLLQYPMEGDRPATRPDALSVFEVLPLEPIPPSPSASVAILTDGVEKIRRPWRLYEQAMTALQTGAPAPKALAGSIPFTTAGKEPDPALASLFAEMGSGKISKIEIEVLARDGSVLDAHAFTMAPEPFGSPGDLRGALRAAELKTTSPGACTPLS